MKPSLIAGFLCLTTCATGRHAETSPNPSFLALSPYTLHQSLQAPHDVSTAMGDAPNPDAWNKAVCTGAKLYNAMLSPKDKATQFVNPIDSQWQGKMTQELYDWGWKDESDTGRMDSQCEFDTIHEIGKALTALGIDPKSTARGGPNKCFHISHAHSLKREDLSIINPMEQYYPGPDGKRYRATLAHHTIGINPISGIVYLISRASSEYMAELLWGYKPKKDEMPQLQRSSDVCWGFWNRANGFLSISRINMIMSLTIVNPDTVAIIERIMASLPRPPGQEAPKGPPKWPGIEIPVNGVDEPGLALLGSPNGQAAGYFLAQHKDKLGATKTITKITLFVPDEGFADPMMMMWVGNAPVQAPPKPPPENPKSGDEIARSSWKRNVEVRIRNTDERNILRERIVMVN